MCDVDHFKKINDTHGHQIGDEVLKWFVAKLQERVRSADWVARYGGEEFVIVLPETNVVGGRAVARSICASRSPPARSRRRRSISRDGQLRRRRAGKARRPARRDARCADGEVRRRRLREQSCRTQSRDDGSRWTEAVSCGSWRLCGAGQSMRGSTSSLSDIWPAQRQSPVAARQRLRVSPPSLAGSGALRLAETRGALEFRSKLLDQFFQARLIELRGLVSSA